MTAPLLFICLLYIIHVGFPRWKQRESVPTVEISGRNGRERKHGQEEHDFFCMLTRLIRVSSRAAVRWGLALHTCQSGGARLPFLSIHPHLFPHLPIFFCVAHPLFPRSLFFLVVFDMHRLMIPIWILTLHLLLICKGCGARRPLGGVSTQPVLCWAV